MLSEQNTAASTTQALRGDLKARQQGNGGPGCSLHTALRQRVGTDLSDWPQHAHQAPGSRAHAGVYTDSESDHTAGSVLRRRPASAFARLHTGISSKMLSQTSPAGLRARPASALPMHRTSQAAPVSEGLTCGRTGAFRWRRPRSAHDPEALLKPACAGCLSRPHRHRQSSATADRSSAGARLPSRTSWEGKLAERDAVPTAADMVCTQMCNKCKYVKCTRI